MSGGAARPVDPPRRSWAFFIASRAVGIGVVAVFVILASPGLRQRLLPPGPNAIHDGGAVPHELTVCRRTYVLRGVSTRTLTQISAGGTRPVLVDTGIFGSCVAGACTTEAASGPCASVVYVRVGDDAYLGYALSGGP